MFAKSDAISVDEHIATGTGIRASGGEVESETIATKSRNRAVRRSRELRTTIARPTWHHLTPLVPCRRQHGGRAIHSTNQRPNRGRPSIVTSPPQRLLFDYLRQQSSSSSASLRGSRHQPDPARQLGRAKLDFRSGASQVIERPSVARSRGAPHDPARAVVK